MNGGKEGTTDQDFLDCLIYNFLRAESKFPADSYLFVYDFSITSSLILPSGFAF